MKSVLSFSVASICLLLLLAFSATASSGDRQESFQRCLSSCVQVDCAPDAPALPLHLRLLFWACDSNCDYKCQRKLTREAQATGGDIHQYHGKWPFVRIWGIQEPASVIFSLLNGYMHLKSWPLVRQTLPKMHPMRLWLSVFIVLGSWAWLWSAVFHTRDFPLTEKLDYFSAGLNVLYIFFLGVVRMLRLSTWRQTRVVAIFCAIPYCLHVGYLSFVRFDYGYNMMANAIVGLVSNVVWFVVAYQAYRNGQPMWWKPAILIVLTDMAFSLEAFDFPPFLDTFDAHSLWHAATIPIVAHWYDYLVRDARWDSHIEQQRKD
ncbi:Per1-like protein [Martensiomyces pterosporus]|nr:Per1-like protein [Martensiomyces pterosporus]